ncbi:MAG: hypothetical protein AAGC70_03000 [Pseudomonadota bacterium]
MAQEHERIGISRRSLTTASVEFVIVGGASLIFIFWIAPRYIASGSNLGLAPDMLPIACAIAIGTIATVQFVRAVFVPARADSKRRSSALVLGLIVAAVTSCLVIDAFGLIAGGAVMTGSGALLLGERRLLALLAMTAGGASVMFLVVWSGL